MGRRNRERVARIQAGLELPFSHSKEPAKRVEIPMLLPGQRGFEKLRRKIYEKNKNG